MKIEVLPNIKHQLQPDLFDDGWSKAVSKYGDTICLVFGDSSPSEVTSRFEDLNRRFGQEVRHPRFFKVQDFMKEVDECKLLSETNREFLKKINQFFHVVTGEIPNLPYGGFALYLARAHKATPLHSHVFDKHYTTPNQLVCWFPKNNVKFPKFEFVAGSTVEEWPDFEGSNAYLLSAAHDHRGEAAADDILFCISFCRKVDTDLLKSGLDGMFK